MLVNITKQNICSSTSSKLPESFEQINWKKCDSVIIATRVYLKIKLKTKLQQSLVSQWFKYLLKHINHLVLDI